MDAAAAEAPAPAIGSTTDTASWNERSENIVELREALKERDEMNSGSGSGGWRALINPALEKLCALVSAAVCYVAAIAWIYVAYGEIGIESSETRPIEGLELFAFFMALVCVTVMTFM